MTRLEDLADMTLIDENTKLVAKFLTNASCATWWLIFQQMHVVESLLLQCAIQYIIYIIYILWLKSFSVSPYGTVPSPFSFHLKVSVSSPASLLKWLDGS